MISEIDVKDFKDMNFKQAVECLDDVHHHQDVDSFVFLYKMLKDLELIQKSQVKQVAALLKEPV